MAAKYNKLRIDRGADFGQSFTYYPLGRSGDPEDWTDWTGAATLHPRGQRARDFDVTLNSEGRITIALDKDVTAALPVGEARWEIVLTRTLDDYTVRFLEGKARIS